MNRGANITAIGIQSHLGPDPIDLAKAEDTFNRMRDEFHLPVWITEFDWKVFEWNACQEPTDDHTQHAIELDNFIRLALRYIKIYLYVLSKVWKLEF